MSTASTAPETPEPEVVVFQRRGTTAVGWILAGLAIGPIGVALLFSKTWWVGIVLAGVGLPMIAHNAWILLRHPPRLRISRAGIWFGGSSQLVPWSQIRNVYVATLQTGSKLGPSQALSFEFRDAAAIRRRLPFMMRLLRAAAVGDLDLSDFQAPLQTVLAQIQRLQSEGAEAGQNAQR